MTETYELVGSIRKSTITIRDHWPDMLEPAGSGGIAKAPTGTVTLADDHSDTDADTPRLERLLSLRREVTEALNSWARIIIEERRITETIPPGRDTEALARFIDTHADWLAGHEAGADADEELRGWANKVRHASGQPEIGEKNEMVNQSIKLGPCPVHIGDEVGACGTTVRAYQRSSDITCTGCGTTDTVEGWAARIVGQEAAVTIPQLVDILRRRWGVTVTDRTLRRWHKAARIEAVDDSPTPRFDPQQVFHSLMRYERRELVC